jgi:hypothetical protein
MHGCFLRLLEMRKNRPLPLQLLIEVNRSQQRQEKLCFGSSILLFKFRHASGANLNLYSYSRSNIFIFRACRTNPLDQLQLYTVKVPGYDNAMPFFWCPHTTSESRWDMSTLTEIDGQGTINKQTPCKRASTYHLIQPTMLSAHSR